MTISYLLDRTVGGVGIAIRDHFESLDSIHAVFESRRLLDDLNRAVARQTYRSLITYEINFALKKIIKESNERI